MNFEILKYKTVDSTNDQAKRLAFKGYSEGTVIIAESQTSGKGRFGNSWDSPVFSGLYMSLILKPSTNIVSKITMTAAVALSKTLSADIKWVNDILINGKKICGILAEATENFIVLGIGVNVLNEAFPEDLKNKATSLYLEHCIRYEIDDIIGEILENFNKEYNFVTETGDITKIYAERCVTVNKDIQFTLNGKICSGFAVGIATDGGLIVETAGETITLRSGEARLLNQYNQERI